MARDGRLFYRACKRTFDIAFSILAPALTAPPMAAARVLIRLESSRAVIYVQERIGREGRVIRVHKLRSVVVDADDVNKYLDAEQFAKWEAERKVDGDSRVTRIGRFICATSLDELFQFWDVLRGEMSVVGPRQITGAELNGHFTELECAVLLSVRSGITGAWRARPHNGATFESGERRRMELENMRNRCFAIDARCIFRTFSARFGKQ